MKSMMLSIFNILMLVSTSVFADLKVSYEDAYVRLLIPGSSVTSGYVTLTNIGKETVVLTGVTSDLTFRTELHEHKHVDGMMKMAEVEHMEILPSGSLQMQPGGYHIMFMNVETELKQGDQVKVTLHFSDGEKQALSLPVKKPD